MLFPSSPLRSRNLPDLFALVILLAFICFAPNLAGDPGVGWHLRAGEIVFSELDVPRADPFIYSGGKEWVSTQWLSDLIFWGVFAVGGFVGLSAFVWILPFLTFYLLVRWHFNRMQISPLAGALGLLLLFGSAYLQWFIRPVIFSFIGLAALIPLLEWIRQRRRYSSVLVLGLLFFVWANFHPAFVVGLFLVFTTAIEMIIESRGRSIVFALTIFFLSLAATLINPYGFDLWRNTLSLVGSDYFMNLNLEWKSPDFHDGVFKPFLLSLSVLVLGLSLQIKIKIREGVELATLVAASLTSVRYIPFLAVVMVPVILTITQSILSVVFPTICAMTPHQSNSSVGRLFRGIVLSVGVLTIVIATFLGQFPGWEEEKLGVQKIYSQSITQALMQEAAIGQVRLYHSPNWGGYITWMNHPNVRPWIDDRNELNGEMRYRDYFSLLKLDAGWQEILARYRFTHLLVDAQTSLFVKLEEIGCEAIVVDKQQTLCRMPSKDGVFQG